jgi:hypothetical protein
LYVVLFKNLKAVKMKHEITNWSKYSDESIDFILSQSEKTMNETIVAYRENTNKSYAALAFFGGILSYSISQIIKMDNQDSFSYFLLLSIEMFFCIGIIFVNLKPKKMGFIGSYKSLLCQDYYENEVSKNEQIKEYKIQTIDTYDEAIKDNLKQIVKQIKALKLSVQVFIAALLTTFLAFLVIR